MAGAAQQLPNERPTPLLTMRGISKRFPGVQALRDVDFTLQAGEVHALLGENGAGKSTLIKILTGVYRRDAGEMRLDGRPLEPRSPAHAQTLGISTVYQEVNLIPQLSVAENIGLGQQPLRWGCIDWRALRQRAADALRVLELEIDVTRPLQAYPIAVQQMVAIARALQRDARLLILDEPTSSLAAHEVTRLFGVMRTLRDRGLGIIFITHFLDQVYAIADRITVLRNGRLVGEFEPARLPRLALVTKMIGRDIQTARPQPPRAPAEEPGPPVPAATPAASPPLLRARGLGRAGALRPVDLAVRAGETVGLAGLLGSGRTELARLLFGVDHATTGHIEIDGVRAPLHSPRAAIAHGLGFCPEDRKLEGLLPNLSVRENLVLALVARQPRLRALGRRTQLRLAAEYSAALQITASDLEQPAGELSGGNQQKVILARWLAAHPRLLILDEPTRGIDVGAKAELERLIQSLRRDGLALVFVSSELDEIVRNCQRVLVLRDRAPAGELAGDDLTPDAIMHRIAGTAAHD